MNMDNPDISVLMRSRPTTPPKCPSCNAPIDPHNGECRCS